MKRIAIRMLLLGAFLSLSGEASAQDYFSGHLAQTSGEAVFTNICRGCHMANAQGAAGAGRYPALAANTKLVEPGYAVRMVMSGNKAMPSFGRDLDDVQIANVVNYIRTHFGNRYTDTVTPAFVAAARPAEMKVSVAKVKEHH